MLEAATRRNAAGNSRTSVDTNVAENVPDEREPAIANHALIAATPELESDDFIRELPGPAVQACLADAILTHITGLQSALERYRTCVLDADRRRKLLPAPEF